MQYCVLTLLNVFLTGAKFPSLPFSPLKRPLVEQKLPNGFLVDLVQATVADWDSFKMVRKKLLVRS